tara:strand:- start:2609 stop:2788 length:180 start_codon:yes stop_codon:yes gene_type:complete
MQFIKKTSSTKNLIGTLIKLSIVLIILIAAVFFLNKIDFPKPEKEIDKIIPNENFKIVK